MRKFIASLAVAALALFATLPAHAGGLVSKKLHWITSAAATVGAFVDSSYFSETGAANATRDTSANIDLTGINARVNFLSTGDSSLYARITVKPLTGSSLGAGGDTLYLYLESIGGDGMMSGALTNLTELPAVETSTTSPGNAGNTFVWKITNARAALALLGCSAMRAIVRGDVNGQFEGNIEFYTDDARQFGQAQ